VNKSTDDAQKLTPTPIDKMNIMYHMSSQNNIDFGPIGLVRIVSAPVIPNVIISVATTIKVFDIPFTSSTAFSDDRLCFS